MIALNVFLLTSTITLLILNFQDVRTQRIDERLSIYMVGLISTLFLFQDLILPWIILLLIVGFGIPIIKEKLKLKIGAGDISVLTWIFAGLLLFNPLYLVVWCAIFAGLMVVAKIKRIERAPGIPFILIAFLGVIATHFFLGI